MRGCQHDLPVPGKISTRGRGVRPVAERAVAAGRLALRGLVIRGREDLITHEEVDSWTYGPLSLVCYAMPRGSRKRPALNPRCPNACRTWRCVFAVVMIAIAGVFVAIATVRPLHAARQASCLIGAAPPIALVSPQGPGACRRSTGRARSRRRAHLDQPPLLPFFACGFCAAGVCPGSGAPRTGGGGTGIMYVWPALSAMPLSPLARWMACTVVP